MKTNTKTDKTNKSSKKIILIVAAAAAAFFFFDLVDDWCTPGGGMHRMPANGYSPQRFQQMRQMQAFQQQRLRSGNFHRRVSSPGGGSDYIGGDDNTFYFMGKDGSSVMIDR